MDELSALVALQLAFASSPKSAHKLLAKWGSANGLWEEKIDASSPLYPILHKGLWKKEIDLAKEAKIDLLGLNNPLYPKSLRCLQDPPPVLYIGGKLEPRDQDALAIVGSRNPYPSSIPIAEKWGSFFSQKGFTIVSGLARGIDTSAHIGALKNGRTIAVIGSGLNHLYPKENIPLAEQISSQGAVITEYPMNTPPSKFHFPRRNRLIAALSLGCLLIEGSLKSGSLNAMQWAQKLDKHCFALAGFGDKEKFLGNASLIETNKARLVENPQEMLSLLVLKQTFLKNDKTIDSASLNPMESDLIAHFPQKEISLEELAQRSQLPTHTLNAILTALLLKNTVRQLPGRLYIKVS